MLKFTYITTHIRLLATGCSLVGVVDDKGVQKIGSLYKYRLSTLDAMQKIGVWEWVLI